MYRKKELALVLLLGAVCLGILFIGSGGEAGAAYPTSQSKPQYQDPSPSLRSAQGGYPLGAFVPSATSGQALRHLSGVVAVPPSTMMGGQGAGSGTGNVGGGTWQPQWA